MRILLCISSLSTGGSERQLALLGSELQSRGHEVHVIYRVAGRFLLDLTEAGVRCHRLQTISNYSPTIFFKFFRLIREIHPDVIHSWLEMMDILAGMAAKLYDIRWIASERSAGLPRRNPIGICRNFLARRADRVVANSKAGELHLRSQSFMNLSVIHNAIPLPETFQNTVTLSPMRLLSVSRLTRTKNYGSLLEALALLRNQSRDFYLDIVGGGEELGRLQQQCKSLQLENQVTFHGEKITLSGYYLNASALISLSTMEGQPNTVLEAASFRCPLLLSNISTHVESVGSGGALFCDGTDPSAVVEMINLFESQPISAIAGRVETAYRSIVPRSLRSTAELYEIIYRQR